MSPVLTTATGHPCTCLCCSKDNSVPAFPLARHSAVLAFTGLDLLRSRAERGRRVPIPLRKRETIKEEQWSFLRVTPNTKRHQNVARLRTALPGLLLCPLTRGRNCRRLLLFLTLARDARKGGCQGASPKGCPDPALLPEAFPALETAFGPGQGGAAWLCLERGFCQLPVLPG